MGKINSYLCIESFYMSSGEIAFEKGKFYNGTGKSFKSEVTRGMNHTITFDIAYKHLKLFKFGR